MKTRIVIGVLPLLGVAAALFFHPKDEENPTQAPAQNADVVKKKNPETNNHGAVAQLEANPSFSDKVPPPPTPSKS